MHVVFHPPSIPRRRSTVVADQGIYVCPAVIWMLRCSAFGLLRLRAADNEKDRRGISFPRALLKTVLARVSHICFSREGRAVRLSGGGRSNRAYSPIFVVYIHVRRGRFLAGSWPYVLQGTEWNNTHRGSCCTKYLIISSPDSFNLFESPFVWLFICFVNRPAGAPAA